MASLDSIDKSLEERFNAKFRSINEEDFKDLTRKNKLFGDENVTVYEYFDNEFFGMERVIAKIIFTQRAQISQLHKLPNLAFC